jgi:hypothetical protein
MQHAEFLTGNFTAGHPYREVFVSPRAEEPRAWMLGANA